MEHKIIFSKNLVNHLAKCGIVYLYTKPDYKMP